MSLKEKYDHIIENLIKKNLTCEELIAHFNKYRYRNTNDRKQSLNDVTDDINLKPLESNKPNSELDKRINNNFVSYFLTLIHEEGNKYLPVRNSQPSTNQTQSTDETSSPTPTSSTNIINFNKSQNIENIFNSSLSNTNTPQSNFKNKKIYLQPLPSNSSRNSASCSPVEFANASFSSKTNNRNGGYSQSGQSSPRPGIFSPKNSQFSSKASNSKPTLFDFISTPNKSPNYHKQSDSQHIINDFKNRFQQHQHNLQQQQQISQMPQSPLAQTPVEVVNVGPKKDYSKLGESVKETLNANDLLKLSLLSNFYTQLILSLCFTFTLIEANT